MLTGLKLLALAVQPGFSIVVTAFDEHFPGVPVLLLPWQETPAFQDQDTFPGGSQPVGEGPSASATADYDYVVLVLLRHLSCFPQRTEVSVKILKGPVHLLES